MKRNLLFLLSLLTLVSCYDDARLLEELQKHEDRIAALETLCSQMNANISSMQSVVSALQTNDFITAVTPITEGTEIVGYTITFGKSAPITIYFGKDGEDGVTPVIGVRQDEDGIYYWTLNGEWMKDGDGNKVRVTGKDGKDGEAGAAGESGADAVTPMLKIDDGWWYVSYNNGVDWQKLDKATGADGDSFFTNVSHDDKYVYFTLADGTVITVAKKTDAAGGEEGDGGDDSSGDTQAIVKGPIILSLGEVTATTVTFNATLDVDMMADYQEVGLIYSQHADLDIENEGMNIVKINKESYTETFKNLYYDTEYYYTVYLLRNNIYSYGEVRTCRTVNVSVDLSIVALPLVVANAEIKGSVSGLSGVDKDVVEVGMLYSEEQGEVENGEGAKITFSSINEDGSILGNWDGLCYGVKYYYVTYIKQGTDNVYSPVKEYIPPTIDVIMKSPADAIELSAETTANCYIVQTVGKYCFKIYKGNSSELIGRGVNSPQGIPFCSEVLWESYGTSVIPTIGDLIKSASYADGYITFETSDTFKEGNAVIAAKDVEGNILWSWHIWLTDQPQEHVYNNNAGTMMDRNLGATSATPGDVGALGLFYQWGRKDPFLGSSSINGSTLAKSTIAWPSAEFTSSAVGTVDYVTTHPTTFVKASSSPHDWQYDPDDTRWQSAKTIYDPCPAGWRVPGGDSNGVWGTAGFDDTTYDSTNEGRSLSISSPSTTWYPASGYRNEVSFLSWVGEYGSYWSCYPGSSSGFDLIFYSGRVGSLSNMRNSRACGYSVRCKKE